MVRAWLTHSVRSTRDRANTKMNPFSCALRSDGPHGALSVHVSFHYRNSHQDTQRTPADRHRLSNRWDGCRQRLERVPSCRCPLRVLITFPILEHSVPCSLKLQVHPDHPIDLRKHEKKASQVFALSFVQDPLLPWQAEGQPPTRGGNARA